MKTVYPLQTKFAGGIKKDVCMCLAQGHNAVTPVRLKLATPRSQDKHSTTEPLHSLWSCLSVDQIIVILILDPV